MHADGDYVLWLVLDTNVLLHHAAPLSDWYSQARQSVAAAKEYRHIAFVLRLYVPWKVVSELDGLSKAEGADNPAGLNGLLFPAASLYGWLLYVLAYRQLLSVVGSHGCITYPSAQKVSVQAREGKGLDRRWQHSTWT